MKLKPSFTLILCNIILHAYLSTISPATMPKNKENQKNKPVILDLSNLLALIQMCVKQLCLYIKKLYF